MKTLKNFAVKYKYVISVVIGLLVVAALYYMNLFKKEITATMLYIDTNPEAAAWKALITTKATQNGRTYEAQLYLDARYMVQEKYKTNPFKYLV